jgi:hypothetical protein
MTYEEFIATACQMALSGADASKSSLLNIEQTAESLVSNVFRNVTLIINADPNLRALLRRTHTIALTTGVGTLPTTIPIEALTDATIADPDDSSVTKNMAYVPDHFDFLDAKAFEPRLGYWNVNANTTTGNTISYIRPSDSAPTKTGNISLVAVTVPTIPTLSTDTLNAPQEFINLALAQLSNALRLKEAA